MEHQEEDAVLKIQRRGGVNSECEKWRPLESAGFAKPLDASWGPTFPFLTLSYFLSFPEKKDIANGSKGNDLAFGRKLAYNVISLCENEATY
jgi:hypothetical protein